MIDLRPIIKTVKQNQFSELKVLFKRYNIQITVKDNSEEKKSNLIVETDNGYIRTKNSIMNKIINYINILNINDNEIANESFRLLN